MGWTEYYVGRGKKRKDLIREELERYYNVIKIEEKGSNIWAIAEDKESKQQFAGLWLTRYEGGYFAYKDIGITEHPFYYDCSKGFYEKCRELYGNSEYQYAKDWLEDYKKYTLAEKERKDKIKSLKVGDKVKFTTANYGNQRIWTISHITDKGKVLFENYNLRGWKKQDFEVLPKDYVVTLKEKYIGSE